MMSRITRLILICTTLALPINALAAELDLNTLTQTLSTADHVEGRFVQKRYLHDMETTLTSHGTYQFDRGEQVIWTLTDPVQETLTLDDDGMQRNGTAIKDSPAGVARLIMQLLNGDFAALESRFDIALTGSDADWQARLTPNSDAMRRYLKRITLTGGDTLSHLEMALSDGDTLSIDLTQTRP
ncbi:LolA family protein [Larsenimonas suaedae]|uniref:Outer membrane lipoprotein carrier protein LolA n=1 Tax=Larsenimonas suaedae TaxID=1851019 RepID=A0ABU1GWR2_9GAMM|nr:outer membrane lipoprotein carrier protein LolA [Larsenimonas suaedae]MCM2973054.1 outer membrane lipoprotein carrier protein LolA [Larsenimonas suaedae]MDR5896491.1 outer membrane lipoprotein carrier protein LolA [Larsenimonas suaedae]